MANGYVEFEATEEQLLQIMANAVNHSSPAGLGFLHYQMKYYKPEEMKRYIFNEGQLYADIDYADGRMVKLTIFKGDKDGTYKIQEGFRSDYQSFMHEYPTPKNLIASVGIEKCS